MITDVNLSDIRHVSRSELDQKKLHALENSYDSFDDQLNSRSNPVAIDGASPPYDITDGRHRVYLARQKGYSRIRVDKLG